MNRLIRPCARRSRRLSERGFSHSWIRRLHTSLPAGARRGVALKFYPEALRFLDLTETAALRSTIITGWAPYR